MTSVAALRTKLSSRSLLLFVALCGLAAGATVATAAFAMPHGTTDLDEVAYQTQANVMRQGHLTLPVDLHVPFFRPFLSGVRGDHLVFKYQPEWPALIAASDAVFGSSLPLRALFGALGVLAVAWFAWELTREQRVALLAAALALASPFSWVQSASRLGYQLTFVLGAAVAAALLRAARLRTGPAALVAGGLAGLAALHRPFDAVLAVLPVLAFVLWKLWSERGVPRFLGRVLVGVAPFAVIVAAYNAAVMGSTLRLPYGITGSSDVFFFGWRASFVVPGAGHGGQIDYTIGRAVTTLGHDLWLMPRFVAIAPVVLFFASAALVRLRRDPRSWLLVAMMVVAFGGYFFWWATANAAHFKIDRGLGPFYDYPVLAPLCVLAAWGIAGSAFPRRSVMVLGAVAIAWAVPVSWVVLADAKDQGDARTAQLDSVRVPSAAATLMVVPPEFPTDPYLEFATDRNLGARHLVGLDVPGRRLALVDRFPDRVPYLIRSYRRFGDAFGPALQDRVALHVVRAGAVTLGLRANVQGGGAATAYLRIGNQPPVLTASGHGEVAASWTITPAMLRSGPTSIAVGVTLAPTGEPAPRAMTQVWYECRADARVVGNRVEVLSPCDGWNHYLFPGGKTAVSREDVSGTLSVSILAAAPSA